MFFLNLSAGEFLALLGSLGGLIAALYLLDRARRKKLVSTLRFWTSAARVEEKQTRKKMRDPWSLILQLVSLCLLLLAIAQLQWGTRERSGRDHVLLLDTSAWSGEIAGNSTVLDREKSLARTYVTRVPARDRLMIVEASALVTPLTSFTLDRAQLGAALRDARPGWTALDIHHALSYAQQAQAWPGGQAGEIVYIGPGEIGSPDESKEALPNLRVIRVPFDPRNIGIVNMAVTRGDAAAGEWRAAITVKNYSVSTRTVRLQTRFGQTVFAPRLLAIGPKQQSQAEYIFDTTGAGRLSASIEPPDALPSDDSVALALPRNGPLRIAVFTSREAAWQPLLEANSRISAKFFTPGQYSVKPNEDIALLDGFSPSPAPSVPTVWVQPPDIGSPLPVKTRVEHTAITNWNSTAIFANGLRTTDARLGSAEVFQTFDGDLSIAGTAQGPVVVARPAANGHAPFAVIGFDPLGPEMRFQLATPLLFANLLRWLAPDAMDAVDFSAGRVGPASVSLETATAPEQFRVRTDSGNAVPFSVHDGTLQMFAVHPEIVSIESPGRQRVVSLTLPNVADEQWTPPTGAASGLPGSSGWKSNSVTLWQALAVLGAAGLIAEWLLFGRRRRARLAARARKSRPVTPGQPQRERELVNR